jgi:hypothetical protein
MVTTCLASSLPARVETFLLDAKGFVWQFLGKHDLLIKDMFDPESNKTLKMRLLRKVPIVLAVKIETGVSCRVGTTFGPR